MTDKPAILQDTEFTIEEGFLYKVFRTGAIWMNKLFFSSLFLLGLWLLLALVGGFQECTDAPNVTKQNGTLVDQGAGETCSVFLSPTAVYLGAMAVLSFLASIAFGLLGLVVGRRVLEATPAAEELGAGDADAGEDE